MSLAVALDHCLVNSLVPLIFPPNPSLSEPCRACLYVMSHARSRRAPLRLSEVDPLTAAALNILAAESFPVMDWLALANHLFLLGSGGRTQPDRHTKGVRRRSVVGLSLTRCMHPHLCVVFLLLC